MPSRTSSFKIETATDSKQDSEITTLTNTLNNLVVPVPTNITCNSIRVNSHTSTAGHVSINAEGSQITILGSNTIPGQTLGMFINGSICSTDYIQGDILYSINDACFGSNDNNNTNVLHVIESTNQIVSETNASISGINNISCKSISVNSHTSSSGAVNIDAEGTQLTVYANNGIYCTGNIITPSLMSAENIYCTNSLTCNQLNYNTLNPPIASKSLLTYYVDGSCGSDSNDGSLLKPFRLIQSAINKCESVWDGTAREVKIGFGTYSENLVISKARIQLTGSVCSRYANVACGINGTITVQVTNAVDMFNSQVMITGFQIVGSVIDASSSVHTLNIKDCFLYGQENIIQQITRGTEMLINGNSYTPKRFTAVDCRTYLENLTISVSNSSGTTPLISIEAGSLEMTSCNITAKSANTNCLQITANASTSTFTSSNFTNDNAGATLKPLILVIGIVGSPTFNSFVNCGFIFGSTATKTVDISTGNNSAIVCRNRDDYFNVLRCAFALQGVTANTTNYIIMPLYLETASLKLAQSSNVSSIGTAYKVCTSGVTSFPFTTVA